LRGHGPASGSRHRATAPAGSPQLLARRTPQYGLDEPADRRLAESGAAAVALASVDREAAPPRTVFSWRGTSMILRDLVGLAAITVSAIVPLCTARVVLGVIVARLQHH